MTDTPKPIVELNNISIKYGENTVMRHISFQIQKGEFVYLIGKTGSGKSSILKVVYADLPFYGGQAKVAGYNIGSMERKEMPYFRRKTGIIFQDFQLFTDRNVADNLRFVMQATGWTDRSQIKTRISYLLMQVGLDGVQNKMPHQLSGGEQQRVAIARALINDPLVVFADEPTGNLDPGVANEILELFVRINQSGTAIVMATHHHNFLKRFPSRVLFCDNHQLRDIPREQILRKIEE